MDDLEVFIYRLVPGAGEEYDRHHRAVWPEIIESGRADGILSHRIYRRGDLVISLLTRDPDVVPSSEMTQRVEEWEELIGPLLAESVDAAGQPLFAQKVFDLDDYPPRSY